MADCFSHGLGLAVSMGAMDTKLDAPWVLTRGLARLLDLGLHLGVLELAARLHRAVPVRPMWEVTDSDLLLYAEVAIGFGAMAIGAAVAEWLGGATVGKVVFGLRVVTMEASDGRPSLEAALVRNLALLVDVQFFGLVAYGAMGRSVERQRVGDLWAGSRVVLGSNGARQAWLGAGLGLLVALVLLSASYAVL